MSDTDEQTYSAGIVIGSLLVLLGVGAYVLTDSGSVTALIPSAFGLVFVVLARLGKDAGRRQVAIYGLVVIAVLGLLGSLMGVSDIVTMATGGDVDRPAAATSQGVMALLSLVMLVFAGRSIAADRS